MSGNPPAPAIPGGPDGRAMAFRVFAAELVKLKDKAGRLGLWKTMHALDTATREVGYEAAEILTEGR